MKKNLPSKQKKLLKAFKNNQAHKARVDAFAKAKAKREFMISSSIKLP